MGVDVDLHGYFMNSRRISLIYDRKSENSGVYVVRNVGGVYKNQCIRLIVTIGWGLQRLLATGGGGTGMLRDTGRIHSRSVKASAG